MCQNRRKSKRKWCALMKLLTPAEVMKILGISRSTLKRLMRARLIAYVHVNCRTYRFREQDVDTFITGNHERAA